MSFWQRSGFQSATVRPSPPRAADSVFAENGLFSRVLPGTVTEAATPPPYTSEPHHARHGVGGAKFAACIGQGKANHASQMVIGKVAREGGTDWRAGYFARHCQQTNCFTERSRLATVPNTNLAKFGPNFASKEPDRMLIRIQV